MNDDLTPPLGSSVSHRRWAFVLGWLHFTGLLGFYSPWRAWFLALTPVTLLLATTLLLLSQRPLSSALLVRLVGIYLVALTAEIAGVATGKVFGAYHYGEAFGRKLAGVPLLIGLNWTALCLAAAMLVAPWRQPRLVRAAVAAMLPVSIDLLIEQVCARFDFWYWTTGVPPLQNYLTWYGLSFVFVWVLLPVLARAQNKLAPYFLGVQLLFFLVLVLLEQQR